MSGLFDIFGGRSLDALVAKARQRLAGGDFDEAQRIVTKGLERYPEAEALRETRLTIRRAQARAGLQGLKDHVARDDDPVAYEQLVALYGEMDMPLEARRAAQAYAQAHPDRDTPHLLLGELLLQSFFDSLQARDAHAAQDSLLRAARLNVQAIKPRLLLAELYFCSGADRALAVIADALARLAPDDDVIKPVLEASRVVAKSEGNETLEAVFADLEVEGALKREPTAWPLRTRRNRDTQLKEDRTRTAVKRLVARGEAEELAVVRRNGSLVAHAGGPKDDSATPPAPPPTDDAEFVPEKGLPGVAASVARGVARQVRDFDLGAFKRCTIQGPFGLVIIGEVAGVVAAVRHKPGPEPLRLWERVTVALEGGGR